MTRIPNVVLHGGPAIPDRDRVRYVEDTTERFKLFRGNRYEHFDPTGETSLHLGEELLVFTWIQSTFVAE